MFQKKLISVPNRDCQIRTKNIKGIRMQKSRVILENKLAKINF